MRTPLPTRPKVTKDRWLVLAVVLAVPACAPPPAQSPPSAVATSASPASATPARLEPAVPPRVLPSPEPRELTPQQLEIARKQREAAAQYKREHPPEPWIPPDLARWHDAMERYVSSVTVAAPRPLNAAAIPFAHYLNAIHNRVPPALCLLRVAEFDAAALDSVVRAQPFGPAPSEIRSSDGDVYLHWEFHRDEVFACSTMHARPFLLALANP